jgi:hypothetical protein
MFNIAGNSASTGYNINNSLRFRASASAYLNRTPASSGNLQKWTISFWYKKTQTGGVANILNAYVGTSQDTEFRFNSSDQLSWYYTGAGAGLISTQVFRDPSAWYHFVLVWDSTNATAAYRMRVYVNGSEITSWATDNRASISSNNSAWNSTTSHSIMTGNGSYVDGYMAEFYNIDGQALTPSSFGATDATTGVWQPKAYTGTYGTNGFYLKFSDIATTSGSNAGLGKDFSGNTNYWVTNNISITAGSTYDAMKDSPTLTSATVANYAVLNPLWKGANVTLSEGNMKFLYSGANAYDKGAMGTQVISSKSYWEVLDLCTAIGTYGNNAFGITAVTNSPNINFTTGSCVVVRDSGNLYRNGTTDPAGTGAPYASGSANDVYMFAYDPSTTTLWIGRNGTWFNSGNPAAGTGSVSTVNLGDVVPFVTGYQSGDFGGVINFGQRPFSYTPPTGYNAVNTYNLPTPTILQGNKYMDATLYTGNGTGQSVVNAGTFKPDLVWVKSRSTADWHQLVDSNRGVGLTLATNSTAGDQSYPTSITSFNSNGFTLGADSTGGWNKNGTTIVGWQWQAGQGSTSSNTNGSITSTVSVNTTAGFSIVTYTGTGANATVGHGLGVAPKMVIVKKRSATSSWVVYHGSLAATQRMILETSAAVATDASVWNSTAPTSSVFSLGNDAGVNGSGASMVAYCFTDIAGFSKIGSYIGNGNADGTFVYTGFRPKFILMKNGNAVQSWNILDSTRSTYNLSNTFLNPNNSNAETSNAFVAYDFLSNGFKARSSDAAVNGNGNTMIFMAFAENPFKYSNAR